ncbi:hypothetical protein SFUMM280S_00173 [Streptomyces fumanus]
MRDTAVVAERTTAAGDPAGPVPVRLAAVFLPAPLPREGRVAFWDPEGGELPAGSVPLTVVRRHGAGVRRRSVPALVLPLDDALPVLTAARHDPAAHPATACWGAAALHALRLVARGRLLPGLTATGHDAWRAGPLDPDDIAHLRAVAAALPPEGHAVPLDGPGVVRLPEPRALIRAFLDAVADTLPRTAAAPHALGRPFAARPAQHLPAARDWAAEVAAGMDAGVRISLRLDLSAYALFDADGEGDAGRGRGAGAAVVQVHSLADPTLVADAADLWSGAADPAFGPRARVDTALAVRRAARVWPRWTGSPSRTCPMCWPCPRTRSPTCSASPPPGSPPPASPCTGPATSPRTSPPPPWSDPRPVPRPTAPASSRARTCSGSAGSSRSAATRSPRPRWTSWPRPTAPSSASATGGCWSTRPSSAAPASATWASSTPSTRCPSPSPAPPRSTARASRRSPSARWPPSATGSPPDRAPPSRRPASPPPSATTSSGAWPGWTR